MDQPDLAQRCLALQTLVIPEERRKSEVAMAAELEVDLPAIQRGLFDLIAKIFEQLPHAKVTSPTRMLDFSKWLAAMELVDGAPAGTYQDVYCDALLQGQLNALLATHWLQRSWNLPRSNRMVFGQVRQANYSIS